jgi:carboxylate-amine ligase
VLEQLLAHVRDALEDSDDYIDAHRMLREVFERGNGAHLQRAAHSRTERLCDVVADAVRRTRES